MTKKKILIVCSFAESLTHFRGDFIKSLILNNYEVFCAAPTISKDTFKDLQNHGAVPISYSLQRNGMNPIKDLKSIFQLKKIIKNNQIDLVFPYTIKPVIYSSIAANMCKISVISLITGLGFTFTGISLKARILQKITEFLYKISIRKNKVIIFQNEDDHQLFIDRHIITQNHDFGIVNGSGVNLDKYKFRVNENNTKKIRFIFVARLIAEKGIFIFIEAAKIIKKEFPEAEFHIIGSPIKSPSAIKLNELEKLNNDEIIVYHGLQMDVPSYLYKSDVFVLPTYYREGIPRSILEALSVGLPIITTNTPGCRETIINNKNGILISPRSERELLNAMMFFLKNPSKIKEMGIQSRTFAKNIFDTKIINKDILKHINKVLN